MSYQLPHDTEKCPQLEELSLYCRHLTDQSVIALAQHCSTLKKLQFRDYNLTAASLIALSERGLPLEELNITSWIPPIPSAEIAALCAHALSRIRQLSSSTYNDFKNYLQYSIKYMTGLRRLFLGNSKDHLLVSQLLLQGVHCVSLENLSISKSSSITPPQFGEIVARCCNLRTIQIFKPTCLHLQQLILIFSCSEVTEEGVLALAARCRQLREIVLNDIKLCEETVRQLAEHCPRLTKLIVCGIYREGIVKYN